MAGNIVIRGARVHNLKNIDLEIPRDRLVVITGLSGSGKSSLAFDTLYAEGKRRYLEALAADARQLLQQIEKPDVDSIEGLSPAIAIKQNSSFASPRSTVGTMSRIYDFLRLLFVRAGQLFCSNCGNEIVAFTTEQIVDRLISLPDQTRIAILAPLAAWRQGNARKLLQELARQGFSKLMIEGEPIELPSELTSDWTGARQVDLVIDRLVVRQGIQTRLAEAVEIAGRHGDQVVKVRFAEGNDLQPVHEMRFSKKLNCLNCGAAAPELTIGLLSFNHPQGACPRCNGLGEVAAGEDKLRKSEMLSCPDCNGTRLRRESRLVRIGDRDIVQTSALPVASLREFLSGVEFSEDRAIAGKKIVDEILRRLQVLMHLGLGYLSLDRSSTTLSGGEIQRVRLATEMGLGMAGVLYILDEPTRGLHQRDTAQLLALLKDLRDGGNTVLVVEHDPETMRAADYVIDMGPGAGERGGEVVAQGRLEEILRSRRSLTGQYLSGNIKISPAERRTGSGKFVTIQDAHARNLKNLTVAIPIGAITCVTGVSGAGKSTLVIEVLYEGLRRRLQNSGAQDNDTAALFGWENFDRAIAVDQQPIGRTPRSNAATYTGIYDHLRALFAELPEARVRGYKADRFSFNQKGGRCEACGGDGVSRVEMHFIPDLFVVCPVCRGRRYNRETLEVKYKGLSIADVLDLTIDQALELLNNIPPIRDRLWTLREVGLGYLRLGQPASMLAGGEAQRVKLARELARKSSGQSLYVLDEPTTGLHFEDTKKLLELLNRLTDSGNTIVIVEHNLDVIKSADYVIDLGPESGLRGGEIIAKGTPEEVASVGESHTAQFLRRVL